MRKNLSDGYMNSESYLKTPLLTMTKSLGSQLAHQRWRKIPKAERLKYMPKNGGKPKILDEFTDLPVSRQRKHQLRKAKHLRSLDSR